MREDLDEINRVILEMLQEDARISFRKIAQRLKVSEATIFVRVKKLVNKGVIKKFTAIVSPEHVGKRLTAFILIDADPRKLEKVFEELKVIDDIYEIYDVTGSFSAILKIRAKDHQDLKNIIDKIGLIDGVIKTETALVLKSVKEETKIKI